MCKKDLHHRNTCISVTYMEATETTETFAQKAAAEDPRVPAIRADHIVGRNTCSVVDECYTDAELVTVLDRLGATTKRGALREARRIHRAFEDRMADCQAGGW